METCIATSPEHYRDPAIFEAERAGMFSRSWTFVGLANELPKPNDYVRVPVAGRDVILQNCGGQLRAFVNSCSHRHARIHEEPCGNRKLICPYHGWTYNDEGIPTGIPKRENFPEVCANPAQFALRQLEVKCAGAFIFARMLPDGPPLEAYLGDSRQFLIKAGAGLDVCIEQFRGTVDANWKVVIENSLEGYHVPMVHRETLGAINQFSLRDDEIVDYLPEDDGHSYMINSANPEWLRRWKRFEGALGESRFKFDHYVHQLIFPNLTVTSFLGYSFHIQCFRPVSVGQTEVHSRIYSVRSEGQTEEGARIMRTVYDEGKRFTRAVFAEDQRVCNLTYEGLQDADHRAVLADHLEKRIAHFQRFYLKALD